MDNSVMDKASGAVDSPVDVLHEIGGRLARSGGFHEVLSQVVEFASGLVKCDSCLIYVLEGDELVLRGSKNAHSEVVDRLRLRVGAEIELARMEEENLNLTDQLQTRKVVERAKGILQRELRLTEEQAYLTLQQQSRQKRRTMKEIAEAIILSAEIKDYTRNRCVS